MLDVSSGISTPDDPELAKPFVRMRTPRAVLRFAESPTPASGPATPEPGPGNGLSGGAGCQVAGSQAAATGGALWWAVALIALGRQRRNGKTRVR